MEISEGRGSRGHLEVWGAAGPELVTLEASRLSIGTDATNDVVLQGDRTVSRLHAVLQQVGGRWSIRDLGSRNGTVVNGQTISAERVLAPGDELRLGKTRLVFRGKGSERHTRTEGVDAPPALTARERDVLVELCRPLIGGDVFTEPASIRRIAAALVVSDDAVKKHLGRLYAKFDITDTDERRRVRLANDALHRGAVSVTDLKDS